jgi:hypothetical protein
VLFRSRVSPARRIRDGRVPARRPVQRVGDLLPDAARALGLEEQLRWARAAVAWEALVEERIPPAAGGSRPLRLEGPSHAAVLVVEAAAPIIAQEILMHQDELLEAFRSMPGGLRASVLRVIVGRGIIP